MIYRTGVSNIKTLYKVIDIEKNVTLDTNKKISINAGGMHVDWVFIQYNGKKKYIRSPVDPSVVLIPLVGDTEAYVDYVRLNFEVNAWDGKKMNEEHDITLVNS